MAGLHLGQRDIKEPLVVTDSQGFELGKEVTLAVLKQQGGVVELTMREDTW